ncbi:MAG: hypothetical protein AAF394_11815 [Planctomycetota bacterium]
MLHAEGQRDKIARSSAAILLTETLPSLKLVRGIYGDAAVIIVAAAIRAGATHPTLSTILKIARQREAIEVGQLANGDLRLKIIDIDMLAGLFDHLARGN